MTLLSPRKPRTTVRGPITPARTLASLAVWLLLAAFSPAQGPTTPWRTAGAAVGAPRTLPTAPVRQAPAPLVQTAAYQPGPALNDQQVQLEPPGLERLGRLDSDEKLFERIRQETLLLNPNERPIFPESPVLARDRYAGRGTLWQPRRMTVEPNFVCYRKMQSMFEDKNMERYGWDFGPLSPVMGTTKFLYDVAFLPMKVFANPCRLQECSAGHCLPGDPVPYMLYPMEWAAEGITAEVVVVAALVAIFP